MTASIIRNMKSTVVSEKSSKRRYYTPLRYPGGKAKLAGLVRDTMQLNGLLDGAYVEPYAGGAGVAIELLLQGYVSKIYLNDLNDAVHAFWSSVIKEPEALCRRISRAKLDMPTWQRQRKVIQDPSGRPNLDLGFAFLYLNRTNRSGIISGGVIGGNDQRGAWKIDARFNKDELIRRVEDIAQFSKSIHLYNMDAITFLEKVSPKLPDKSFVYLDPPYFEQGSRLYDNFYKPGDHAQIARHVSKIEAPWMVSYDDVPQIRHLYRRYRQSVQYLQYSAAEAYVGTEALIFGPKIKVPSYIQVQRIAA